MFIFFTLAAKTTDIFTRRLVENLNPGMGGVCCEYVPVNGLREILNIQELAFTISFCANVHHMFEA